LDSQAESEQTTHLVDVSYADDGTIIFLLPALDMYDALVQTLVVVSDAFAKRGHKLNIGAAKTAAMVMWRGHGMKRARHAAWHEHGGRVCGTSVLLGNVSAPLVHNYVHLGSVFDANGSLVPEIKYRATTTNCHPTD